MTQPTVTCIMLTRDRPELAARAVECFRRQTYPNKHLLVYDNGQEQGWFKDQRENETHFCCFWNAHRGMLTIGALRNEANGHSDDMPHDPEILLHWDSDDWSHPNRIAGQVALLQASGADAVGYSEMLFWRTYPGERVDVSAAMYGSGAYREFVPGADHGEAWIFRYLTPRAIGTSLCYWRKTWERKPFPDLPKPPQLASEDVVWQRELKVYAASGLHKNIGFHYTPDIDTHLRVPEDFEPRLIARIHGSNTMPYDIEGAIARGSTEWRRAPEWDSRVAEIMK
jgi:glycosyltransferase involved in cell wall biosynthesis